MDARLIALDAGFIREPASSHVSIGRERGEQRGEQRGARELLKSRRFKIQSWRKARISNSSLSGHREFWSLLFLMSQCLSVFYPNFQPFLALGSQLEQNYFVSTGWPAQMVKRWRGGWDTQRGGKQRAGSHRGQTRLQLHVGIRFSDFSRHSGESKQDGLHLRGDIFVEGTSKDMHHYIKVWCFVQVKRPACDKEAGKDITWGATQKVSSRRWLHFFLVSWFFRKVIDSM